MIYKFKSKAAADLLMTEPVGRRVLALIGKEAAGKGILEAADLPAAIRALEAAVSAEGAAGADDAGDAGGAVSGTPADRVSLRQRVWPMVEMMKRAQAAGEPIVWGV